MTDDPNVYPIAQDFIPYRSPVRLDGLRAFPASVEDANGDALDSSFNGDTLVTPRARQCGCDLCKNNYCHPVVNVVMSRINSEELEMFDPVTISQAIAISERFNLSRTVEAIEREVSLANGMMNTEFPASSRECCERNEFYMRYHSNSFHARVYDPRDVLSYWYVQEADESRIEGLVAADFEDRAYGRDWS